MRKTGRIVSYLLVFVMLTSLFSGVCFKSEKAKAAGPYTILEIVPDDISSGQLSSKQSDLQTLLGGTVTFVTRTPAQLKVSPGDLEGVDLIVINKGNGSFKGNNDFDWKTALAVMKKVAGVSSNPVPYLIDYSVFSEIKNDSSLYKLAIVKDTKKGKFASPVANLLDQIGLADADAVYDMGENTAEDGGNWGSANKSYKLFCMLTAMNPATFYGLYIANHGENYGIDDSGSLLSVGAASNNGNVMLTGAATQWDTWAVNFLRPYFLLAPEITKTVVNPYYTEVTKTFDESGLISKLGYKGVKSVCTSGTYEILDGGIVANNLISQFNSYKNDLKTMVNDYKASGENKNDYYHYRVLVVQPNGVDGVVNRSLIADVINNNRSSVSPKGLVGGIQIDCISMYNFDNYAKKLSESYDIIYFGHHADNQAIGTTKYYVATGGTYDLDGYAVGVGALYGNSGTKSALSGNDLTKLKYEELQTFRNNGHKIIVSKALLDSNGTKVDANTYMYKLLHDHEYDYVDTNDDGMAIVNNLISTNTFSVVLNEIPAPYVGTVKADWQDQNGRRHLTEYVQGISNYSNYINNSSTHRSRNLEFDFDIKGSTSATYTMDLYVDMDGDWLFENTDDEHLVKNYTISDNHYDKSLNVLPDGYVGPVTWKLVIKSGNSTYSKIGYSACRAESSSLHQSVNILQIYPTDCSAGFKNNQMLVSTPSVVLPSEYEVFIGLLSDSHHKKIGEYESNSVSDLASIQSYFSDILTIDSTSMSKDDISTTSRLTGVSPVALSRSDDRQKMLLDNAGYTYYLIQRESNYNLNVTKVSVNAFNDSYGDFEYNKDTGVLTYPAETFVKNENGAIRVYTTNPFHTGYYLRDNDELAKYSTGGEYFADRELVADGIGYYGYRNKSDSSVVAFTQNDPKVERCLEQYKDDSDDNKKFVTPLKDSYGTYGYEQKISGSSTTKKTYFDFDEYFKNNRSSVNNWDDIKDDLLNKGDQPEITLTFTDTEGNSLFSVVAKTEDTVFDIVIMGFGMNTDYMVQGACDKLVNYLDNNGTAFIGNGAVTMSANNTLGKAIRKSLGQDRYNVTDYDIDSTKWVSEDKPYKSGGRTDYDAYLLGLTREDNPFDQGNQVVNAVAVNDTTFAHFPYTVPNALKTTAGRKQNYQLDLEDPEIVVSYAKYKSGGAKGYGNWADARENYYCYKKGNITFLGVGNTFDNYGDDQLSTVMTMPETMLYVNSLVTSAKFKGDSDQGEPYLDCKDFDCSVKKESDVLFYDSVYVDYDGINVMTDDDAPIDSVSIDGNYRRILYYVTTVAPLTLEIKDASGNAVSGILLYEANADGTRAKNSDDTYKDAIGLSSVSTEGYYLLYVPLSGLFSLKDRNEVPYTIVVKKSGTEVETHVLTLLRRAMFRIS